MFAYQENYSDILPVSLRKTTPKVKKIKTKDIFRSKINDAFKILIDVDILIV